jgi:hypothetical protein
MDSALHRRPLRQGDDSRSAMPVTPRALHAEQRHPNGYLGVARLNTQVQIDDGAAGVACDDQPMVLGNERGHVSFGPEADI